MAKLLRSLLPSRPAARPSVALGEGWVRPHWLERAGGQAVAGPTNEDQRRWTVIGSVDSPHQARVDVRGLVQLDGRAWSLDWWIGAEDRWHVPAREEVSVRQSALGSTPVVETRVRVPGGDAVQRAYAVRDAAGRDSVVVEIENDTKVPFAVALAIRPYGIDGVGGVSRVEASGTELRVDGEVVATLTSAPRHAVASDAARGDASSVVFSGAAGPRSASSSCPDGLATLAVLHPLAHTATLRVVLPFEAGSVDPKELADVRSVVSGWQAHARSGTRAELPDRRLQGAVDSSLRHLLLRHDGHDESMALDRFGFGSLAADHLLDLDAWRSVDPTTALVALADHWSTERDAALAGELAPAVAGLVEAALRPARRASSHPQHLVDRLALVAELLQAAGEPRAAEDVMRVEPALVTTVDRARAGVATAAPAVSDAAVLDDRGDRSPAATLRQARMELGAGAEAAAQARLSWVLGVASGSWTWPTAIPAADAVGGRGDGHDPVANAQLVLLVRELLVRDHSSGIDLSPVVPDAWIGQGWELHDAPTLHGRLSFAVRWHGERPALLWDLDRDGADGPVRLTVPGLDPSWSSDAASGEALLAPVAIPERAPRRGIAIPVSIEPTPRGRP